MFELHEIENKIVCLSQKDLNAFRNWFYEYDNQVWDKQFENDVKSEKIDDMAAKALLEYQSGEYSAL